MKKLLVIVLGLLVVEGAAAQSHSFRDTTRVRYQQFDFDAWLMADTVGDRGKVYQRRPYYPETMGEVFGYSDILQYNYTDNPDGMRIVGLSAVIELAHYGDYSDAPMEFLLLYDAMNDTFQLKAQIPWHETDTAGLPYFGFIQRGVDCNDSSTWGARIDSIFYRGKGDCRILDYYFDKPVTVYDSFYVGGTDYTCMALTTHESFCIGGASYVTFRTSSSTSGCYQPTLWKMYHYDDHGDSTRYPLYQWMWKPTSQFMMVLPIIDEIDTSFANAPACPRVSGLFARGNYTDTVTVQWAEDSLHGEFELSYGREGTRPEDGTVVTVYDNRWQFTDAAYSDTPMVAYVRTVCREYDTLRWSGWSSPVYFRLHHNGGTGQEGIAVPEENGDLSRFVRLMPNPASGSVVVMSSYGIDRMEVYDVRGERVLEQKGKQRTTSAGFDVTAWAKGIYVVLVYTPSGTAAKRLVVGE